ncbi:hypothetical protein B4U80_01293 [Leptotrombidium deliense]|uniref:Uncharacterized protein n=1 Tax=Leptotrombidium deliense TaxID=299467 RepID=A0A443S530_9ACAR|nr:hypothetical protein B4U80_01293 [Leptotrombidium deliense]
MIIAFVRAD